MQSTIDELISQLNQLSERVGGYTPKTYNLLACILLQKNDIDRALKIFSNAVNELALDTEEGQQKYLSSPQSDISCLLFDYIKCILLKNGQGMGIEYLKGDAEAVKIIGYLNKCDSASWKGLAEERKNAETMFDQAVAAQF